MEILLSFCLRCLSRTASMTLRVSGSFLEPSLLRISAKNRKKWLLSSLALYFQMTFGCRPHLPSIDPSLSSVDCIFFFYRVPFRRAVVFLARKFPGAWSLFFWKTKKNKQTTKTRAYAVVMVTSLYHLFFCFTSVTQKYHHYQRIKFLKFLGLYYNLLHSNQMTSSFCP